MWVLVFNRVSGCIRVRYIIHYEIITHIKYNVTTTITTITTIVVVITITIKHRPREMGLRNNFTNFIFGNGVDR